MSQVRDCAAQLTRFARQSSTVLILVGHVTKDGSLAGPKVLEHMIDCSILIEDHDARYRTLRGQKNRFEVSEVGIFAMTDQAEGGTNPFCDLPHRTTNHRTTIMVVWKALVHYMEIQPLVDDGSLGNPRRVAVVGKTDWPCCAVLHRHAGIQIGDQDVFANVVSGVST